MTIKDEQPTPPGGWLRAETARIPPLALREMGIGRRLFLKLVGRGSKVEAPNLFLVLMRHWRLFRPWLSFAARLMPYGTLDRRDTELTILRVAWNCRCRYEWGQHVEIGLRAGLAREDIARVVRGPDAPGWTPQQAVLLRAADEFHRDGVIARATWQELAGRYADRQLIELCMLIGHYQMLAGVLNSLGLPLEQRLEAGLVAALGPLHGEVRP